MKFGPYVATQYSTSADKEKFAKQFVRFVEGGFKPTQFPKWFYNRLNGCFGHIAHFNQGGFYDVWFSSKTRQRDFLLNAVRHPCYGDPAFTYSDVERQIGQWIEASGLISKLNTEIAWANEASERAELARLKGKYEGETNGKPN